MRTAILLLGLFGFSVANIFEDGMQYIFDTDTHVGAGTMDFAPHVSGFQCKHRTTMQVAGSTITVKMSDVKCTEYNGKHDTLELPFEGNTYSPGLMEIPPFSVELSGDGTFKSLTYDQSLPVVARNLIKGWAQRLQINMPKAHSDKGFKSLEKSVFGTCHVSYSVSPYEIIKSVAHMKDCDHPVHYKADDWQGHKCHEHHAKENPEGLFSTSNTVYKVEKKGDRYHPHAIVATSVLIGQFYDTEGLSQYAHSNSTSILDKFGPSPGGISAVGSPTEDLDYEFQLEGLKWNDKRDLKAPEPHFATGKFLKDDQATIIAEVKKRIAGSKNLISDIYKDPSHIQSAHGKGINMIFPPLMALSYDSLKSIFEEFSGDKSEAGIYKFNVFTEMLGSIGTSASAILVKDMVLQKKFDNVRDALRILSAVPFHIQHPNEELLTEYKELFTFEGETILKETIPIIFGSMVRRTCESAGEIYTDEAKKCFDTVAKEHVKEFYDKIVGTDDHHISNRLIPVLTNIRYGGVAEILKPFIYGETKVKCQQLRTRAVYAAGADARLSGHAVEYFMPIFANHYLDHELRIAAFNMLMSSSPSSTDFSTMMVVLYQEKDYEVINYVYTAWESLAHSITPCNHHIADLAKYFVKYLEDYSQHEGEYGFGVSKVFLREFTQSKYGYGGTYTYSVVGSHKSTTPLTIYMSMSNYIFRGYKIENLAIYLRVEGLAKALVRRFKKMDPAAWKMEDLEKILYGEMGITAKPDQKIKVHIGVMMKGSYVLFRQYDQDSIREGGNVKNLVDDLMSLGDTYSINHQRILRLGDLTYQQPLEVGLPATFVNSYVAMFDISATVKKGNSRGLLFRDVKYKMNFFGQGQRSMFIMNPARKLSYGIAQDRIYQIHAPRNFVIGVNVVKKEFKLSIERPPYDDPLVALMHSQSFVFARSNSLVNDHDITAHCADCKYLTILSRGDKEAKGRVFVDRDNHVVGSFLHGEYFDCEMENTKGKVLYHLTRAFAPYNKNPKTLVNIVRMGIRQIRAYLSFYPRTEKCGVMARWSQSKTHPVKKLEFTVRFNREENGERMFFRGRKMYMKTIVKAIGEPADRVYKINLAYEFTPGNIENKVKFQFLRAGVPNLMDDYAVCFNMENKYPDFTPEFLNYEKDSQMDVTGKGRLQYGKGKDCSAVPGEIRVTFKHETTTESRQSLQKKWYFKQCMALKNTPAWADRGARLPVSKACFLTVKDATTARKYHVNVEFVKLTDRMNAIVSQFQAALKTGLLPYWDIDPEIIPPSSAEPHMTLDLTFKDGDKAVDLYMETSQGGQKFEDIHLSLDWYKRMRGLKFSKTIARLMDMQIIDPCIVTSTYVNTLDNTTYNYEPTSCWTLASGHCAPVPSYAVFVKKAAGHPLAAKAYFGGHSIEFKPSGPKKFEVIIDGASVQIGDKEYVHTEGGQEIFKVYKWGHTYNVYSFLKLWINYDGHYISMIPAPSVRGQHCGLCGSYNRNQHDEFMGKDGRQLSTAAELVDDYKWKC